MAGKTTIACSREQYETLITTIFTGIGTAILPNPRIATILEIEANTGRRIGDILALRMNCIIKTADGYRFDMIEQKTNKRYNFPVPDAVFNFLSDYCNKYGVKDGNLIFPISERAVQKHLAKVCDYLGAGYENISSHSFRKYFGTSIYYANGCDLELVRRLYQHSSAAVTARYLGISDGRIREALENHVNLISAPI